MATSVAKSPLVCANEKPSSHAYEQPSVGAEAQLLARTKEPDLPASSPERTASLDDQARLEQCIANPELMRAEAAALRALAASKTQMWPPDSPEPDYGLDEEYKGNVGQYDDLTIVEEPRTPERRGARKGRPRAPSLRSIEDDLALQMVLQMYASEPSRQSLRQQAHDRLLLYGALSAMHGSAGSEATTRSRPLAYTPSTIASADRELPAPAPSAPLRAQPAPSTPRQMKGGLRKLTWPLL
ncbi:hypothetical protein EV121DRAFT_284233 [Schizophyllum commune]